MSSQRQELPIAIHPFYSYSSGCFVQFFKCNCNIVVIEKVRDVFAPFDGQHTVIVQIIIKTDVEPWSKYIEKQAAKQAKRDAKGKKKKSVDELM